MKSLVIIPTYNEIENISEIINAILKKKDAFHILVVDDQSPDGTAEIVKNFTKKSNEFYRTKNKKIWSWNSIYSWI